MLAWVIIARTGKRSIINYSMEGGVDSNKTSEMDAIFGSDEEEDIVPRASNDKQMKQSEMEELFGDDSDSEELYERIPQKVTVQSKETPDMDEVFGSDDDEDTSNTRELQVTSHTAEMDKIFGSDDNKINETIIDLSLATAVINDVSSDNSKVSLSTIYGSP